MEIVCVRREAKRDIKGRNMSLLVESVNAPEVEASPIM